MNRTCRGAQLRQKWQVFAAGECQSLQNDGPRTAAKEEAMGLDTGPRDCCQETRKTVYRKPLNFALIAAFVTPQQKEGLRQLSLHTRIPQQALPREALDNLLKKCAK